MSGQKILGAIVCICLFSFIIVGCAQAPYEVKEEIKKIKEARTDKRELKDDITYVKISDLGNESRAGYTADFGLLRFEGEVVVPECKNVYFLEMKVNDEIFHNLDHNMRLIMEFTGAEETDWEKYITEESGRDDEAAERNFCNSMGYCFLKTERADISIKQSGWMSIDYHVKNEEHPYFLGLDGEIVNICFFTGAQSENLEKEINLNGVKVTMGELTEQFERSVSLFNQCSPGINLKLHDARIIKDRETQKEMLVLRALSSYEGLSFDSNYIAAQDSQLTQGKSFLGFEMNQQIHQADDACKTSLRERSYIVSRKIKEYSNVIDFDSALHIIEQTVPRDKLTTIEYAEFLYQIFYQGEEGEGWEYNCEVFPDFYAAPVWKFVEKDRPDEMKATVYYVDAVTGEVHSFYKACTP